MYLLIKRQKIFHSGFLRGGVILPPLHALKILPPYTPKEREREREGEAAGEAAGEGEAEAEGEAGAEAEAR